MELLRSIIEHKKIFVLALNGPGVGGGAAWFEGVADIVLAAEGAYLQVPFSALGLVPESGSAIAFTQSMGVHRSNDFLMFGRQLTVEELEKWGMVNRIFPKEGFHESVLRFLNEQLAVNDGKSMIEAKRLQNAPLRDARILALYNSMDALAERFVADAPLKRFQQKKAELEGKFVSVHLMGNVLRIVKMLYLICVQPNPKKDCPKSNLGYLICDCEGALCKHAKLYLGMYMWRCNTYKTKRLALMAYLVSTQKRRLLMKEGYTLFDMIEIGCERFRLRKLPRVNFWFPFYMLIYIYFWVSYPSNSLPFFSISNKSHL